jgi:hypothetical protein
MSLWKSWFGKAFQLAFVATLSAELATQIDLTSFMRLPVLDLGTWNLLVLIVKNSAILGIFVSLLVGFLAAVLACVIEIFRSMEASRARDAANK